jgi:hypothetical protein
LQTKIEHLQGIEDELFRNQEIIAENEEKLLEDISNTELENIKLSELLLQMKDDYKLESSMASKSPAPDLELKWNYWVDEPEFDLPNDNEPEEDTGFLSALPSLPSFNFITQESKEAPPPPKPQPEPSESGGLRYIHLNETQRSTLDITIDDESYGQGNTLPTKSIKK